MELALYCPELGFYEREKDTVGRRGDFYTSVSVGSLFGRMLAFQFAEWAGAEVGGQRLEVRDQRSEVRIVEAGAHDGRLAADVLNFFRQQRTELFQRLHYVIIEPSAHRRSWQGEGLAGFGKQVSWLDDLRKLDRQSATGEPEFTVILSNELLDSFPVHRLGWDAKEGSWFEWGVTFESEGFQWTRLPVARNDPIIPGHVAPELLDVLPDQFTIECCPEAETWWRAAADVVRHGRVLTFDYGFQAEEFFRPERTRGTLRAYREHRAAGDLLANPGEQDLTAHVNFSVLQSAGEVAGLTTDAFVTQAKFLTSIAEKIWKAPEKFGGWTPKDTRQFQTLTHPEHLGRSFRVLVQSRLVS